MGFSTRVCIAFVTASLCLPAGAQAKANFQKVFQVGSFDLASAEFAGGRPDKPVNFIAGQSAAKDWYATQAAASAPAAGAKAGSAPRTITFSLPGAPAPSYRLRVSLLIQERSVPDVRVGINGRHGMFYLRPELIYANERQNPSFSHAAIEFTFPGSYLRSGTNAITLQVLEDASKVVPGAELTYDAIALDRSDEAAPEPSAQIFPTIFYQRKAGQLYELVDVVLHDSAPIHSGANVDLEIAGRHYRSKISAAQDFGEEKFEVPVAEFPKGTQAHLTWDADGRRQQKPISLAPAKKWTLYLVPHIHLDIGYSDYQAKVAAIHSRVVDEAMDLAAKHPGFHFSLDGMWPLEEFMQTHTAPERQRAIAAIRKQQLYLPAEYANLLTGFPTAETLIRSLYPSANFSREHGTPFNYANITDVPSYSWSYASVLASAGIHILLSGCNNFRAPVLEQGQLNRDSPFWWQGPDGQKVLFWYSRMYQHMQMLFGLPPEMASAYYTLPIFLQQYEHPSYRADAAILYGTQVENTDLFPQQATFAAQWNGAYAYPRLEYSGFYDAMKRVAQKFGNDIPVVRGDGGPYWEDGIGSDAFYAAMERNTEARALSAEKLATLTSLINPKLAPNKDRLDKMWTNMLLMDEHTWDSYNSVSEPASQEAVKQLAIKDSYAVKASAQADFLTRDSMATLVNSITAGRDSLTVFNSLNWSRSGLVALDLNRDEEIFDLSTGKVVPYEVLGSRGSFSHVRFLAEDIPAVGYKVFQIRHIKAPAQAAAQPAATNQTTVLESPYYRVTLDPESGAVQSIYDKQLQRELVNRQSPYRFGQYLYVTGGDHGSNKILAFSHVHPDAVLQMHPAHSGKLISVERTPYGWAARMKSTDTNTPGVTTEIQLFEHEKKIEFIEDVDKKEVTTKEGVYFAFPFAMQQPQFQYEIQTGVVDPAKDMYPGAGHEWFSVQHWVSVQQNGVSGTVMPLDAPLVTLGDINRGKWPAQFGQRPGSIFSYVMNNYWNTNYRAAQGGHFHFRYVVTSAPSTDAAALSRMGWEEMTPLEHDRVTSQDKAQDVPGPLSGKQDSFLQVSDANVLLDTWKAAEDHNGVVLRFLDLGGTTRKVTVRSPLLHVGQAWQTDAVERHQNLLPRAGANGFEFTMHPHEIVTVKIFPINKKNK